MRTKKTMFFLGTFLILLYTVIIMKYQIDKIKKPSAMIQTNVKELTLTQRKIINFLIYTAQHFGDQKLYSTTLATIKKMCKIGKTENLGLKEQFRELKKIDIEFNYLDKDKNNVWEITGVLCSARVSDTTGEITFEIPYMLREKILNPEIYTPLNVHLIAGLKSKYSIVLYELLRDYLHSPEFPKLSIVQLRKLLGLKENQYKLFKDFKKRVLDRAVNEINSKTDIKCSYLLIKEKGNKYSHIKFTVKENKLFQLPATVKTDKNFCLFLDDNSVPEQVIMHLPEKHRISGIYRIVQPWFNDIEYLISNIVYTNKNCKTNYSAFLSLALKEDYAQISRESKQKLLELNKKKHLQERKSIQDNKLLKQKVWDYFNSLPEIDQFKFRADAEETVSSAIKIIKTEEQRNVIINAQLERNMIVVLQKGKNA